MSKYAIIQLQGKQYQVAEGDEFIVDRLASTPDKTLEINEVLLLVDGDQRQVGQPLVKGAKVNCEILAEQKGEKLRVAKYKAKSRYRKVIGHRQLETVLKVKSIS